MGCNILKYDFTTYQTRNAFAFYLIVVAVGRVKAAK